MTRKPTTPPQEDTQDDAQGKNGITEPVEAKQADGSHNHSPVKKSSYRSRSASVDISADAVKDASAETTEKKPAEKPAKKPRKPRESTLPIKAGAIGEGERNDRTKNEQIAAEAAAARTQAALQARADNDAARSEAEQREAAQGKPVRPKQTRRRSENRQNAVGRTVNSASRKAAKDLGIDPTSELAEGLSSIEARILAGDIPEAVLAALTDARGGNLQGKKGSPGRKKGARLGEDAKKIEAEAKKVLHGVPENTGLEVSQSGKPSTDVLIGDGFKLIPPEGIDDGNDPELDATKLIPRWQVFIEEYLIDYCGSKAAIRSGYSIAGAKDTASRILHDPRVRKIVQARTWDRIEAIRMSRSRVIETYEAIAEADHNELSEHRRVCCRHCWGERDEDTGMHARQFTPAEWQDEYDKWEERRTLALLESDQKHDIGDFPHAAGNWYDKRKPLNPDCPECFGEGVGEVHLKDTRYLSRRGRLIYQGVKEGKDGIEMKSISRDTALGVLAKHHKLYEENTQVTVNLIAPEKLDAIYTAGTAEAFAKRDALKGRGDRVRAQIAQDVEDAQIKQKNDTQGDS